MFPKACFLSLLLFFPASGGQEAPLRLKTELVQLHAVVTDKQGRAIENLNKEDFELFEDGRPQDISFFSSERSVRSASSSAAPNLPTRTVIFLIDALSLSNSSVGRVKQTLRQFVDHQMTDQDVVAVVTTTGMLGFMEQLTTDREFLRRAIDKITSRQTARLSRFTPRLAAMVQRQDPEALSLAIKIMEEEDRMVLLPPGFVRRMAERRALDILAETTFQRQTVLSTVKGIAARMAELPGQRLLVLLSDGIAMLDLAGTTDLSGLQAAVSRAARSGVVIYSIQASGLATLPQFDVALPTMGTDPSTAARLAQYMVDSEKDLQDGLNALAVDTGGKSYFNNNDLGGSLKKVLDEIGVYYVLAYHPSESKNDNRFRRITVRVKGHPEYDVRVPKGYLPSTASERADAAQSPRKRLVEAMLSPLPATGIGVIASADYLETEGDDGQVSIQIHVDGQTLDYRNRDGLFNLAAEITVAVYDHAGKLVSSYKEDVSGKVTPENLDAVKRSGLQHRKRLPLKPGFYQIRVGVLDSNQDQIGTAIASVDIPNLKRENAALSSLLLTEVRDENTAGESGIGATPFADSADVFRAGNLLVYYVRVYNSGSQPGAEAEWQIQVEVVQGEQTVYQGDWQPLAARTVGRDKKGLEVGGQFRLVVDPGTYELRIRIKHGNSKRMIERARLFRVVR